MVVLGGIRGHEAVEPDARVLSRERDHRTVDALCEAWLAVPEPRLRGTPLRRPLWEEDDDAMLRLARAAIDDAGAAGAFFTGGGFGAAGLGLGHLVYTIGPLTLRTLCGATQSLSKRHKICCANETLPINIRHSTHADSFMCPTRLRCAPSRPEE